METRTKKSRIGIALAVAISVFFLANWYVGANYAEIVESSRYLISLGGGIFAGIITYFLFMPDRPKD
ncbi:histidine kinase [Paenisporosarcina cavernae]|uniref:Histidine kinase n=1 Tax=Paenisporosarcina cavernae TaxID=2320858 RepID=A0A385YS16_9BACL|nr:histidine kinase [Paenisporosarcina cavernae]AYC28787.1 histidine kinase [Paenisporosarcina cavernae]